MWMSGATINRKGPRRRWEMVGVTDEAKGHKAKVQRESKEHIIRT